VIIDHQIVSERDILLKAVSEIGDLVYPGMAEKANAVAGPELKLAQTDMCVTFRVTYDRKGIDLTFYPAIRHTEASAVHRVMLDAFPSLRSQEIEKKNFNLSSKRMKHFQGRALIEKRRGRLPIKNAFGRSSLDFKSSLRFKRVSLYLPHISIPFAQFGQFAAEVGVADEYDKIMATMESQRSVHNEAIEVLNHLMVNVFPSECRVSEIEERGGDSEQSPRCITLSLSAPIKVVGYNNLCKVFGYDKELYYGTSDKRTKATPEEHRLNDLALVQVCEKIEELSIPIRDDVAEKISKAMGLDAASVRIGYSCKYPDGNKIDNFEIVGDKDVKAFISKFEEALSLKVGPERENLVGDKQKKGTDKTRYTNG